MMYQNACGGSQHGIRPSGDGELETEDSRKENKTWKKKKTREERLSSKPWGKRGSSELIRHILNTSNETVSFHFWKYLQAGNINI